MPVLSPAQDLAGKFDLAAAPGKPFILLSSEASAAAARKLVASSVPVHCPEEPGAWQWVDLRPLVGRNGVLLPDATPDARSDMLKLAERLHGLGCRVDLIDLNGQPEDWTLADWAGTKEEFQAWAQAHRLPYTPPPAEPEPPQADEPAPEPEFPPEAQAEPPKRTRTKPRLAAIDGNTALEPQPEAQALPQPLSEDHLAHVFAERHGENWRYVSLWNRWFKWAGGWVADETAEVFHLARELCRDATEWPEAASLTPSAKRALGLKRLAGNVRDMAGTDPCIAATADQWDRSPWLLGVPGGVIDLQTGKLLEAERVQYITKRTAVAPVKGEHPLWDKVLSRASQGDTTMAHYLAKWAGYMLTGDTREEAFLFVHGPGGSGKSTFVQVLRDCMGSYAKATRIETFMTTRHGEHPTEIADLAGARLVSAPETEEGSRWNEGRIKMLTGRDKVKARFMGRDYFEFDPVCKIMIFGNHRPRLHSVGAEMKRRLHMVEFPHSIPEEEQDRELKTQICAEYPAILQWMIDGSLAWQEEGLGRPEAVSQSTDDYLASQDTLGAWLEECCERSELARCMVSGAYRSFENWAKARGEYVPSVTVFSEKMQARGVEKRKVSVMYFLGLALKTAEEPPIARYPD